MKKVFEREGVVYERRYKEVLSKNIKLPCVVELETSGRLGKFNKIRLPEWVNTEIICNEIYEDPEQNNEAFVIVRDYDDMIILKEPVVIFNVVAKSREKGSPTWAWYQAMEKGKHVVNRKMKELFFCKDKTCLSMMNLNGIVFKQEYKSLKQFKEKIGNLYPDEWEVSR